MLREFELVTNESRDYSPQRVLSFFGKCQKNQKMNKRLIEESGTTSSSKRTKSKGSFQNTLMKDGFSFESYSAQRSVFQEGLSGHPPLTADTVDFSQKVGCGKSVMDKVFRRYKPSYSVLTIEKDMEKCLKEFLEALET
jgi:hypothetical protein